jgi:hypothetical protein
LGGVILDFYARFLGATNPKHQSNGK